MKILDQPSAIVSHIKSVLAQHGFQKVLCHLWCANNYQSLLITESFKWELFTAAFYPDVSITTQLVPMYEICDFVTK